MQSDCPKQYLRIDGREVLRLTLERICTAADFARVVLAVDRRDERLQALLEGLPAAIVDKLHLVDGGRDRAHSVFNALQALSGQVNEEDWIMVHDAVRPCVRHSDVHVLLREVEQEIAGGILALPVRDTIKQDKGCKEGPAWVAKTLDRSPLWMAATPQLFRFAPLHMAMQQALEEGRHLTDEASAVEMLGLPVRLVPCRADNIKLTWPDDLVLVRAILRQQQEQRQ